MKLTDSAQAAADSAHLQPVRPPVDRGALRLTRSYEALLRVLFGLTPLLGIVYLQLFQSPTLIFEHHLAHELAIAAATGVSAFVCWVTWRCYLSSGEPFLRWLTLGFLGFTLIYAPHGLLTRLADHNLSLFLNFGPSSRLVMVACLLYGLLQYGKPAERPAEIQASGFWRRWVAIFVLIDLLVIATAMLPASAGQWIRLPQEAAALVLALSAIALMLWRRIDSPLMTIYTIALAFFAQSSLAFFLARAWNHQWWMAHTVFAAGFFVLSFGVTRAFHTTRAFSLVYGQEEMIRRLEEANAELRRLAATDSLTGASNRRHFMERLAIEWERARREGIALSLLAIDLDHFKDVNDEHGHQAGDEVLRRFVAEARTVLRPADLLGRTGGEEFAVLLPDSDAERATAVAERLRARMADTVQKVRTEKPLRVTASIGVASFGPDGESGDKVFRAADKRLYKAKNQGRNRVVGPDGPA